jgi:hypothetical protein
MALLKVLLFVTQAFALLRPAPYGARPSAAARLAKPKSGGGKGFGAAPAPKAPPAADGSEEDGGGMRMDVAGNAAPGVAKPSASPLLAELLETEKSRAERARETIADLEDRDAYVREKGVEAGRVPDAVANRMVARMATFGGLPAFGGVGLFVWFYFSATQDDNVFQPTLVASATTVPWVIGLLGIGYGALSASWDEDVEGSPLGLTEIKLNVGRLFEGIGRSAKDAALRDRLDKRDDR